MVKQGGMGDRLLIGGYNLSGDIGSLQRIGGGPAVLGFTDITQSAESRLGGTLQGGIDFMSYFDPATNMSHDRLGNLPTTDAIATYGRGTTLGNPSACVVAKQVNYDGTRNQDGSFMLATSLQSSAGYPLEWGRQLTAGVATATGATSGTGVDFAAQTAFGAQVYIHVTAFTGTDATILVQASSDNGVGDAFAEPAGGLSSTQITSAPFSQRMTTGTAVTIERYMRQAVVTTGGFTSMTYIVVVVKNETAIAY